MSVAFAAPIRRFTVDEVLLMVEQGVLGEDEHVELLDGLLIEMPPQGAPHAGCITRLTRLLARIIPPGIDLRVQLPLQLGGMSLPEPDLALVTADGTGWAARHPGSSEVLLVVEIAWTSQQIDQDKATLYSRAGVTCCWLIDLKARTLTVLAGPDRQGGWQSEDVLRPRDEVLIPGTTTRLSVKEILVG